MLEILLAKCANVAVPEATAEAMRYYRGGNVLWIISQALSFLIPLLFLATSFTGVLQRFSQKIGRNWFFTIAVYLTCYTAINAILTFPLSYYAGFVRQHAYGLSTQPFGKWMGNWGKETFIAILGAVLFIWIFYLLLKKSPKRWWFYGSLASIAIAFFISFIQPIWISPLFNKFGPMKNKELEAQILHLAQRAGIENGRVYEVNKSEETKMLNAYVTGFGKSGRIVLWDTTLQRLSPDQILFVMGHEMGHYVLHHIWWGLGFFALISFATFYLTYRFADDLLAKYGKRFGVHKLSEIGSYPLLLLLVTFFSFFAMPLENAFSRVIEHNADTFGLEITQDNQAAGEAFAILQQDNLANPRPGFLFKFWRCSHPPLAERIEYCNDYCPWTEGKPLKYGKHFE